MELCVGPYCDTCQFQYSFSDPPKPTPIKKAIENMKERVEKMNPVLKALGYETLKIRNSKDGSDN
jgi:hypothetical protein